MRRPQTAKESLLVESGAVKRLREGACGWSREDRGTWSHQQCLISVFMITPTLVNTLITSQRVEEVA